jgi:hypothetical protein
LRRAAAISKETGLGDRFFLDGYNLSGDVGALQSIGMTRALIDVTGIDKDAHERLPGLGDSEITWNAWFNPTAGQSHPQMKDIPDDRHVMYWRGSTAGVPVAAMVGTQATYDVQRGADGALATTAQVMNKSGDMLDWGKALTDGPESVTGTGNLAGVDLGTGAGEVNAYLQVISFVGTNITFTLQHSLDDDAADAYAAITGGAFTQVTAAPAKERIEIDGPVERYVRVAITGTFTSCTFVIGARRLGTDGPAEVRPATLALVLTTFAPTVTVA